MSLLKVFLALFFVIFSWNSSTRAAALTDTETESKHRHAVEIARSGNHEQGLVILRQLLKATPDYYPAYRDLVIITSWTGDCKASLTLYEKISERPDQEPYLVAPVSECLYESGHRQQALDKLQTALESYPNDNDLISMQASLLNREQTHQVNEAQDDSGHGALFQVSAGYNESDQRNREWLLQSRYTRYVDNQTRFFARFITIRADDPQFDTGDLTRLGAGIHRDFLQHWYFEQEFSFDLDRYGEGGATFTLAYEPGDRWHFDISHTTFTEDLPLRAKAQDIDSNRTRFNTNFHTLDYRWTWSASLSHYLFSDNNNRRNAFTALGYAYVLKPEREQRIILELFTSRNTEINTVYYNPLEDSSISLVHQLDVVYDSRFLRHVDHLYVSIGSYSQQGQNAMGIGAIRYVQEYDFDKRNSMRFELAWRSSVYDAERESESAILISYSRKI